MSSQHLSRGMLLCNPGNLRISRDPWLGKITPSADPEFEQFDTIEHGIRALTKNILTSYGKYGRRSIASIISRHAPPSENNTKAYIEAVERMTGIDRAQILDIQNPFTLNKLVKAICFQECGKNCVTGEQVATGVQMALS